MAGTERVTTTLNKVLQFIKVEACKPADIRKAVEIIGPSSTGKTQSLEKLAKGNMTRINVPQLHEDAVVSLPYPNLEKGTISELIVTKFAEVFDKAKAVSPAPYLLFLDELAAATKPVQKVLNDILDKREIAGRMLPFNVCIVAASNAFDDQCGVGGTMTHTIRRKRIFNIWYSTEEMFQYATEQNWHSEVLGYLSMKPCAFYCDADEGSEGSVRAMFRKSAKENSPFPCSSGWETISRDLHYFDATNKKNKVRKEEGKSIMPVYEPDMESYCSVVGDIRGREFNSLRGFSIPSHADLIEERREFPEKPMARWVAVIRCGQLLTPGNSEKTIGVIRNLNPEMVEVFLCVAGNIAKKYLESQGKGVPASGKGALMQFPGFRETLFQPGSRYAEALEATV